MKITLSTEQAVDICMKHEVLGGADTYKETRALVEYFEEIEEMGVLDLNLDPVALRCAFSIYTLNDAAEMWEIDTSGQRDEEHRLELIREYLRERTTVIEVDKDTVIVEEF